MVKAMYQFPPNTPILLDGRPVEKITAFLFPQGGNEDPKRLQANAGKSFIGSYVLGMGFTFDDTDQKGEASPLAEMERLIAQDPRNAERIFPYIGGEEVNTSPTHAHHRYVINFGEMSEQECRESYPDLMAIVEEKVKPKRLTQGSIVNPARWWMFARPASELQRAIAGCDRVLFHPNVSQNLGFAFLEAKMVFAAPHNVFALEKYADFAVLQSRIHESWARFFGSSMKDDLRYTPSDCFETFPFPEGTLTPSPSPRAGEGDKSPLTTLTPPSPLVGEGDKSPLTTLTPPSPLVGEGDKSPLTTLTPPSPLVGEGGRGGEGLEAIGKTYYEYRADLMVRNNEGLTATYNRFHDPHEDDPEILTLRELHGQMDRAVLAAYGWQDIDTTCGFVLDYLDEDPETLPTEAQERLESGNLSFETSEEAAAFDGLVRGSRSKRGKLPWRYKWPEAIHDEVLARLLALNQERYEQEIPKTDIDWIDDIDWTVI